jgi:UPF0755 protein
MLKKIFVFATVCALLLVALLATVPVTSDSFVVNVPQGASLRAVSKIVAKDSIAPAWLLELTGRLTGGAKSLKTGRYTLPAAQTALGFWQTLGQQTPEMVEVKLLEGWTFKQFRAAINAHTGLKHETQDWDNAALMKQLGAAELHPEGRFFPDTYMLVAGSSDVTVYKTAFERMKKVANKVWESRPATSPLKSVDDLINLAAIVEKETGLDADRGTVASVFHNRLNIGMRLQTDPTVIYGMGEAYKGRIRKVDLQEDTPYNTYTRAGLPPTPIAAPSEASLRAAMNPPTTQYIYFVAKGHGSGGSTFSVTLAQHNRAVQDYLARR